MYIKFNICFYFNILKHLNMYIFCIIPIIFFILLCYYFILYCNPKDNFFNTILTKQSQN